MSDLVHNGIAAKLQSLTPARVGLGRTGISLETRDVLEFQLAHARARDAVHARLDVAGLAAAIETTTCSTVLQLHSAAANRVQYLQRPDLGRQLNEASRKLLSAQSSGADLVLIVADGLSSFAIERHVPAVLNELLPRLATTSLAPICIVEQARVAIGDEIGQTLGAQLSIVFIGERPGLSSPDSLGAYITWQPRSGRTDAERVCISNIRTEGLSYTQAASQLERAITQARERRLTGVASHSIPASLPAGEEKL
ncbi:ethanolamine ammonia-lyase subunit EutC [Terracidiphilus gabretensis]|uniref:ethanolamine ammonia-lyase subunit EutC n=1 Tax=Terracidiphilus gabretensis TaxID=1577687 RepID=UPI00071BFEBC|nr:ethanolamine ammonia-lyase subunit EutC [Terracidiphilus gabretensis]